MASPDLLKLLDSVLVGEVSDVPAFERSVSTLGTRLRSSDLKAQRSLRSHIEVQAKAGIYDANKSQLVLLYLENVAKGLSGTLRLEAGLGPSGKGLVYGEMSRWESYLLGKTGEISAKRIVAGAKGLLKLDSALHSAARRAFNGFFSAAEIRPALKSTTLKLAVANLQLARRNALSSSLSAIMAHKWALQEAETALKHQLALKSEVCKRLVSQLRRAVDTQRVGAISDLKAAVNKASISPQMTISLLSLQANAQKTKQGLETVLMRWKERVQEDHVDLYRPTKFEKALEFVARSRLRVGLDAVKKDRTAQAKQFSAILLKQARKPLNFALNSVKVTLSNSGIQRFARIVARVDGIITPDPLTRELAYRKWATVVPKVLKNTDFKRVLLSRGFKIFRKAIRSKLERWARNTQAAKGAEEARKVGPMLICLSRILTKKAHRTFTPPYIVKDADEILRRQIKKLMKTKDQLLKDVLTRWVSEKDKVKYHQKMLTLSRILAHGNNFSDDIYFFSASFFLKFQIIGPTITVKRTR